MIFQARSIKTGAGGSIATWKDRGEGPIEGEGGDQLKDHENITFFEAIPLIIVIRCMQNRIKLEPPPVFYECFVFSIAYSYIIIQ